jgi:hypothetical protein
MSLEFVIIPFNATFEETALTLKTQIEGSVSSISLSMDTDYVKSYNNRQNKWEQEEYNTIMVNHDYVESNYIIVTIDSKQERMTVEEFIDLVSNFEHNDDDDASDNSGEEDNCVIC